MSKKVYVATLHTGNTLTIHSQTFFKGHPQIVDDESLYQYLKDHPNFKVAVQVVQDEDTSADVIEAAKAQLRKEGEYVAPSLGETEPPEHVLKPAVEPERPPIEGIEEETATPRAPVRRGARTNK